MIRIRVCKQCLIARSSAGLQVDLKSRLVELKLGF